VTFFENRTVYEIMWKNIVARGRSQITIWRMRIACWINRAADQNRQYLLLFHDNSGYANAPICYFIRTFVHQYDFSFVIVGISRNAFRVTHIA